MKTLIFGAGLAVFGCVVSASILPVTASAPLQMLVAMLAAAAILAVVFIIGCLVIIAGEIRRLRLLRRRARRAAQLQPGIRGVIEGGRK